MLTISEAAALLREFDHVLILTHIRPDGDTVGCAAALCAGLRALGKTAYLLPNPGLTDSTASCSLRELACYLSRYYEKKVIILLDEYDTPLQEAWVYGYWEEMTEFIKGMFNSTFKTNPYLERAIMTGITRISKESIFSDLNNLEVVTTT